MRRSRYNTWGSRHNQGPFSPRASLKLVRRHRLFLLWPTQVPGRINTRRGELREEKIIPRVEYADYRAELDSEVQRGSVLKTTDAGDFP